MAITAFLEHPTVPVEVGEVRKARVVATSRVEAWREPSIPGSDRRLVPDLADGDPTFEQPAPCRLEVVDDEIDVANGSGAPVRQPPADLDRAARAGRSQLHHAERLRRC